MQRASAGCHVQHGRVDVAISSDFSHHQTLSGHNNERATGRPTLGSLRRTGSAKVAGFVLNPSHTTLLANYYGHLSAGAHHRPEPRALSSGMQREQARRGFTIYVILTLRMSFCVLTLFLSLLVTKKSSWSSISGEHSG